MMTWTTLYASFLDGAPPALPVAWAMRVELVLGWALVLAWLAALLGARLAPRWRWGLVLLVFLWTCIPGPLAPAYWLGLAFQAPSLSAVLLAAWGLRVRLWPGAARARADASPVYLLMLLCAVVLGYVLLLDTLGWVHFSLYYQGFAVLPLAVALGLALVLALWAPAGAALRLARTLVLVLLLFALTRLPSGNVWDALLDPWLWLLAHASALRAYAALRAAQRAQRSA